MNPSELAYVPQQTPYFNVDTPSDHGQPVIKIIMQEDYESSIHNISLDKSVKDEQ